MLIRATRLISTLALRAMFYASLFIAVVIVHMGVTTALRAAGWPGGLAMFASGATVLASVLLVINIADIIRDRRFEELERQRLRQGLPEGACCVIWNESEDEIEDEETPWEPAEPLRPRYPPLAQQLGVEGVAVVEFEVNAEGGAKNVHCIEFWPTEAFYEAARAALAEARFQPKFDTHVRFGSSYRMPFVFRIAGISAEPARLGRTAEAGREGVAD